MRLSAVTAMLSASLASCAPMETENRVSGVPAYDWSTRTLTVNGRQSFHVPESMNTVTLRTADEVTLTWERQGDRRVVRNYTAEWDDDRR